MQVRGPELMRGCVLEMRFGSHRKKTCLLFYATLCTARDAAHKVTNCSLFRVGTTLRLSLMVLRKREWQSNRDNYIVRFVICALTSDHVKDDEIGGVHSAHVTNKEKIPLEIPKHT